jgi:trans-2-enoyl-CoA reductase
MDVNSVVLGLILAFALGGIALLIMVYAPPKSERLANALVSAAIKLIEAAVKALSGAMEQDTVISAATFDPAPEQRLDDLVALRNGLEDWKK